MAEPPGVAGERHLASYRTSPVSQTGMPGGIPYIISNEAAERFSFYGMRGILVVFMTKYLVDETGQLAVMGKEEATGYYHLFVSAVYFTPLLGALLSDVFIGKYRTILLLSLVYCAGHLVLALDDTRFGLAVGLGLISLGSGGIKPCVSAHVGDQFGGENASLLEKVFQWFYFSINLGAAASMVLTPILLEHYGPHVAFGVPGALMFLATLVFWIGRREFVHIPPGGRAFIKEATSREGLTAIGRLAIIYAFVAMFWALFDQTGSAWILQAEHMDRNFLGVEWLPSQIAAINPILVMVLIPVFSFGLYPAIRRFVPLTPLRKIGLGFFLMIGAFLIPALIEHWIQNGQTPSIGWQLFAYVILTSAELLVSITCLEFSYTQAPKALKSLVMAFFLMSISVGNLFTAAVNFFIQNPDGSSKLEGPDYYLFFAGAMLVTAIAFIPVSMRYREKTHIQGEEVELAAEEPVPAT
jgi:POT family proton-dependent oligopeptide transporter